MSENAPDRESRPRQKRFLRAEDGLEMMQDPILNSFLKEFSSKHNITHLDEATQFEYFSAYCSLFRDFSEYTELENVIVGGGNDGAIDGIGIFVNDIHIENVHQFDEIVKKIRFESDFCFIQSKTSKSLNAAEIGSFIQGVKEFFADRFMSVNDDVQDKRDISDHIFQNSVKMRSKPSLHLYYCYTGTFKDDANIRARVDAGVADLQKLGLFSHVEFFFLDSEAMQGRYQEINLRIEKEIQINEFASLPQIDGIRQSYLGVLPAEELVKLLSNADGKLQKSLFNENVRDFLNKNPVNDGIESTVRSREKQSRLPALNNGITIVARSIQVVGKRFTLSDFQIVNGCQTSNIVFKNREKIGDNVAVPVKLIEVEDRELINEIVKATNRQTEVKDEAFEVLGEFHKSLEQFFAHADTHPTKRLVYERRKRQYADSAFNSTNIVTLTFLTNSYVSCFLNKPVDAVDYYGVLLRRFEKDIFRKSHSRWPYLASAVILREIENLCVGKARKDLWRFRFILAALVRRSFGPAPAMTDDKRQRPYCEHMINDCRSETAFRQRLLDAERKLAASIQGEGPKFDKRNAHQDREFVRKLLAD